MTRDELKSDFYYNIKNFNIAKAIELSYPYSFECSFFYVVKLIEMFGNVAFNMDNNEFIETEVVWDYGYKTDNVIVGFLEEDDYIAAKMVCL